jgi:DNA-binding NtrC family response regulator
LKIETKKDGAVMFVEFELKHGIPMQDLLCDLERLIVGTFLAYHNGNKSHTAKSLRLNRTTLLEKARKYGYPMNSRN